MYDQSSILSEMIRMGKPKLLICGYMENNNGNPWTVIKIFKPKHTHIYKDKSNWLRGLSMTFDQSVAYSRGNHPVVKIKDKKKVFF